jgi:predicted SAM-dependent methyltransferase
MIRKNKCSDVENYSLYSKKYQMTLKKLIKFELMSIVGRLFFPRKPPVISADYRLLNLGCGGSFFNGWVNADFFTVRFWKFSKSLWMLDMRYPLRCESDYWDGIFTEHAAEHLYPTEARLLFRELYRTIKKGCWLRISVPDLRKHIDYYLGRPVDKKFKKRWPGGAEALRSLTQNWGHRSVWDERLLALFLRRAGFINVRKVGFREGTDKRLLMEKEERKWESLYMEAQKPS